MVATSSQPGVLLPRAILAVPLTQVWCSGPTVQDSPYSRLQSVYLFVPIKASQFPSCNIVFLQDALTPSLVRLVTGTSCLIPQTTQITCKGVGEDAADQSQGKPKFDSPYPNPTPYPRQSVLGVLSSSAFRIKKREEAMFFSVKADSHSQGHSPKALRTPAVLLLTHLMIAQRLHGFRFPNQNPFWEYGAKFLSLADH